MNIEDHDFGQRTSTSNTPGLARPGRMGAVLLSAALLLGACGSGGDATASSDNLDTPVSALPLDDEPQSDDVTSVDDASVDDAAPAADSGETAAFDVSDFTSLADLEGTEITPEIFEALRTDETARAAVLVEMGTQGLSPEESDCFLDEVSPGLFIAFAAGEQPDEEQFTELLGLLDTCEIAFGS